MEPNIKTPLLSSSNITCNIELISQKSSTNKLNIEHEQYNDLPRNQNTIVCSSCKAILTYPSDCYCIQCSRCLGITAIKPLSSLFCIYCGTTVYYLTSSSAAKCKCGRVYKCNPAMK